MRRRKLTEVMIRNLSVPEKGQLEIMDTVVPGFGVRVSQGGTKTFMVRMGKQRKRVTVGRYPMVGLAEGRKRAKEILLRGAPVVAEVRPLLFEEAVERFLAQKQGELKESTWWSYKTLLARNFSLSGFYVSDIDTATVLNEIDRIKTQSQKAHSYTAIKILFNWCIERHYLKSNPLDRVKKPRPPTSKDRVLSDEELANIWHACQDLGRYGAIVRLLMITGQRRNQISRLQERWVDHKRKRFAFPAEVMKNNAGHMIPMCSLAEFVVLGCTPFEGYYFSPVGFAGHPFNAWSKSKVALDKLLPEMDPWTLHDLRRTWATNAARLDVPPQITDRVLSHSTGTIGPVARIYNRWNYWDGMLEAMNKMNSHLLELVGAD